MGGMGFMEKLLYGVAYYDEYMPYERLDKDIAMMKAAGINVVRIAESTWSSLEPKKGEFNFYHIDKVIDAMEEAGLQVIVGTPTYAIPSWLSMEDEEILATTKRGKELYGRRQNMDITNETYLFYSERIIRKLIEHVTDKKCVIGYQLDNETKHYDSYGNHIQMMFKEYLINKFRTVENLNKEFGLAYWSNALGKWEDLPNVLGTINGSFGCEYEKFRRDIVTKFLTWQSDIVQEYKREDQFITQNFDFDWCGSSYGVQPDVNHFSAANCLTIAGVDIYHPSQEELTGAEIAFGGDIIRSLKQDNYLVLETQAQGFKDWLPMDGQLRLQAFSHVASGANMVAYWHWHSLHNAVETYWKGLLSHDLKSNATYEEAKIVGKEFAKLSPHLVNLKKENKVAILVSNEALTSLNWFPIDKELSYNKVFRWVYDTLYEMNVECDILFPESNNLEDYNLIVVPALYSAPTLLLERLDEYVKNGGHMLVTFKSGFTNEYVTVSYEDQPHVLSQCLGVTYNQFTNPKNVSLKDLAMDRNFTKEETKVSYWMELLKPTTAKVIASYNHKNWGKYAAITKNEYGKGNAVYVGCYVEKVLLKEIVKDYLKEIGLYEAEQNYNWPLIIRKGYNDLGKKINYYFNYSDGEIAFHYIHEDGQELTRKKEIRKNQEISISPWDFIVVEESGSDH